jgi:hypothetical protein
MYNFHGTKLLVTNSNRNAWNRQKKFSEILLQKTTFLVVLFRYWLLSGELFGDVRSVAVEYTTVVCSNLDRMDDSANITFHDFTVTGLV